MYYYYYYRWYFPGDDMLEPGYYHSTVVTEAKPSVFLANVNDKWFRELLLIRFETQEAMKEYWKKQTSISAIASKVTSLKDW